MVASLDPGLFGVGWYPIADAAVRSDYLEVPSRSAESLYRADDRVIASIRSALLPLCGLPLWAAGRAANILWLQFGARESAPTTRNPDRIVGEYALHLTCPWRVSSETGVVAGASDLFVPADPDVPDEEFQWDRPGAAIVDLHLRRWIGVHAVAPLRVTAVEVDRCGGFVLRLEKEFALEVFPDASAEPHDLREQWRLLQPGRETPHFVLGNHGVD